MTPGTYRFDTFFYERTCGANGKYLEGNGAGVDYETLVTATHLFAERIVRLLDSKWDEVGNPAPFNCYEIGAGDGTLYKQIMDLKPRCSSSIKYSAVEINDCYKDCFPSDVEFINKMPQEPVCGVIFGSSVLNAQPFRFVSFRENKWKELFVEVNDSASYFWQDCDYKIPTSLAKIKGKDGSAPLVTYSADLLKSLTSNFSGSVAFFEAATLETVDLPGRTWFQAVLNKRPVPALDLRLTPSLASIVPIDQLEELFYPAKVTEQATWFAGEEQPFDGFYVMEWQFVNGKPR